MSNYQYAYPPEVDEVDYTDELPGGSTPEEILAHLRKARADVEEVAIEATYHRVRAEAERQVRLLDRDINYWVKTHHLY
jgi:hypothetical protein